MLTAKCQELFFVFPRIRQWLEPAARKDFRKLVKRRLMDQSVGREHVPIRNLERLPVESRHFAPGFFHNQNSGSGIPRVQVELPESVEAPARDIREIERRRSGATHAMRSERQLMIKEDVGILVPLVARKSSRDEALREPVGLRNFDFFAVQERAPSEFGVKKFIPCRVV